MILTAPTPLLDAADSDDICVCVLPDPDGAVYIFAGSDRVRAAWRPTVSASLNVPWAAAGARVSAAASFDGCVVLGASTGELAIFSARDLSRGAAREPPVASPSATAATLPCAVAHISPLLTRHVPRAEPDESVDHAAGGAGADENAGVRVSVTAVFVTLASGDVLSASWPALRAGGAAPFRRWVLGSHTSLVGAAAANPLWSPLHDASWEPRRRFASALAPGLAAPSPAPYALLVAAGERPPVATYHATDEESVNDIAELVNSVKNALAGVVAAGRAHAVAQMGPFVPGWIAGLIGSGGGSAGGAVGGGATASTSTSAADSASAGGGGGWRGELPTRLEAELRVFSDASRRVVSLVLDPSRRLALIADTWGRVALIDAAECAVLRLWKGYRDAQLGWLEMRPGGAGRPGGARTALAAVIYAPRRNGGVVDVFRARFGPRVATKRIGALARLVYAERVIPGEPVPLAHCFLISTKEDGVAQSQELVFAEQ
jgi:hypothetical protein